jgi:hypothetical protein
MELNRNDESSAILRVLELMRIDLFEVFCSSFLAKSVAPPLLVDEPLARAG